MAFTSEQAQQFGLTPSTAPIPVRKPEKSAISQVLPGIISNFTGSPAANADFAGGGAVPNIVWKTLALPSMVKQGYHYVTGTTADPDSIWNKPLEYTASGINRAHELTGIEYPKSTSESFFNVLGELGSVPIGLGRKAFMAATSKLPKPLEVTANIAGATLTPGLQSKTLKGATAETGLVTGLVDTISEAVSPEYESAFWTKERQAAMTVADIEANTIPPTNAPPPTTIPPKVGLVPNGNGTVSPQVIPQNDTISIIRAANLRNPANNYTQGLSSEETADIHGETTQSGGQWSAKEMAVIGGVGVAAAIAGTAGVSRLAYLKRQTAKQAVSDVAAPADPIRDIKDATIPGYYNRRQRKNQGIQQPPQTNPLSSSFTPVYDGILNRYQIAKAQTVSTFSPMVDRIKAEIKEGIITADRGKFLLNRIANSLDSRPVGVKIKTFMETNTLPTGSNQFRNAYQGPTATDILNSRARHSPETQQAATELSVIETRINDLMVAQAGTPRNTLGSVSWGGNTLNDLMAKSRQIRLANPEAAQSVDEVQAWYNQFLEFFNDAGLHTDELSQKLSQQHGQYVPIRAIDSPEMSNTPFGMRLDPRDLNSVQPNNVIDPFSLMGEYATHAIKAAEKNGARRDVISNMIANPAKYRTSKTDSVGVSSVDKKGSDTVSYYERGEQKFIQVKDPFLRNILDENPDFGMSYMGNVEKMINGVSQISKQFITGKYNPNFALTRAPWYDVFVTMATKNPDLAIGQLSKHFKNLQVDPSALLNPFQGGAQILYSNTVGAISKQLNTTLRANDFLVRAVGSETVTKMAAVAEEAYRNSTKVLHESGGGGSSLIYSATSDELPVIMRESSPELFAQMSPKAQFQTAYLLRAYNSVMEAAHSGNRVAITGLNLRRQPLQRTIISKVDPITGNTVDVPYYSRPPDVNVDRETLARQVREIGGDLGRKQGIPGTRAGKWVRRYGNATNYANVAIQSMARMARGAVENPTAFVGSIAAYNASTMAYIYNEILEDPVKRDKFLARSRSQQSRGIPLYDDDGNELLEIGIPNEVRMVFSPVLQSMLYLTGHAKPSESVAKDLLDAGVEATYKDALWEIMPQAGRFAAMGLTGFMDVVAPDSPLSNWIGRPKYYDQPLGNQTNEANLMSTMMGIVDTLTSEIGTNVLQGAYSVYKNFDEEGRISGDDFANIMSSHATAPFRRKGQPTALLWDRETRLARQLSTDRPEYTQSYESVAAAKDWMADYKAGAEYPDYNSSKPGYNIELKKSGLEQPEDPARANLIASQVEGMQRQLKQNNIAQRLSDATKSISQYKEGGTAFLSPDVKIEGADGQGGINHEVVRKDAALTEQLKIVRDTELRISQWLQLRGYEDYEFNFIKEGHSVVRKGKSPVTKSQIDPRNHPYLMQKLGQ